MAKGYKYVLTCQLTEYYGEWDKSEPINVKNPETQKYEFGTYAVSDQKAISNICFRMKKYGLNLRDHSYNNTEYCYTWTIKVKQ